MRNIFKAIALVIGLCLGSSGCGTGVTLIALVSPTISTVSPQVVTAGTPSVTVTVQGANFQAQSALTVNGAAVPTTVVNSTTLAAQISGSTLASPATAQLQVNTNGVKSNEVPFTVTTAPHSPASLSITTAQLASAQVGSAYSTLLSASGGTPSYTWTIASGSLPAGLTLTSAGVLAGTPTASGTSNFSITVSDSGSPVQQSTISFSISVLPATVTPATLSISTTSLAAGQINASYSGSLTASGGTPAYTWSISSGSLPAGLTLSASGVISGTPTGAGSSTFTVSVADSGSPAQTASVSESITIAPAGLNITTSSLAAGKNGTPYSATVSAIGGTPGYTWSVASGSLPAGLTLSAGGVISGTPTATGTSTFTVAVKDSGSPVLTATQSESITVAPAGVSITTGTLAAGQNGTVYSATLSATGGTPGYTWSVASGSLPAGLTLSAGGAISGTPTGIGTSTFTVAVTDSGSPALTASQSESITVSPVGLSITTSSLAGAQTGTAYTATLSASGGTPGYTWTLASGTLPAGLTLSSSGVISGTATTYWGTATFTVTVKDSASPAQTVSAVESIKVTAPGLTITTTSLAAGTTASSYSANLTATGGTPSYGWFVASGSLPPGLSLSTLGTISGTPTTGGTFNFTIEVSDNGEPIQTVTAAESITITATGLAVTTTSLSDAETTIAYNASLGVTGGTPGYTWSVSGGSLPAGLTLSSAGVISGTATTAGTSNFTVTVKDTSSPIQSASVALTLTVDSAPTSTGSGTTWYVRPDGGTRFSSNMTQGQCDGKGDQSYAAALAANGGVAAPNLHCAFSDIRLMYGDGSYNDGVDFPGFGWVMQGGDTLIIRGSVATGVTYRIGWDTYGNSFNCSGSNPITGVCGNPYVSSVPVPPAGTATNPTRILGENYQSCSAQGARTSLRGGADVFDVVDLAGASYVDLECLDISDYTQCDQCTSADDKAVNGIELSNTTSNTTLTNVRVHGLSGNGVYGPTGDAVTMDHIDIIGNHTAGWEADNGTTGLGHVLMSNFSIMWNGCVEEYPIVDAQPYFACRDDSSGGYGDGFGSASQNGPAPGWQVHFDKGVVAYNTQDGLDGLHLGGPGTSMTVTRVLAYGNMGQQIKIGAVPVLQNNIVLGNCYAMHSAIPGTPAGFNQYLTDYCRAGDSAVVLMIGPQNPVVYQNNTLYTNGLVGLEIEYLTGTPTGTETIQYNNNIMFGFLNYNNENPSLLYSNSDLNMFTNSGASYSNNVTWGEKYGLPCPGVGEVSGLCVDPGLVDETWHDYDYGNMSPLSTGNAVQGMGVALPGVTTDYTGQTRGNPPTIGAYESSH